jgi:hypothetical protein
VSAVSPAIDTRQARSWARSVAPSLARVEAKRMLRHPLTVLGALFGSAALVFMTWREAPVLNRHDASVAEATLPIAGAMLIVAHFASMRAVRHRATDLYDASPTSNTTVTAAQLLAVACVAAATLLVELALLGYLAAVGGVGGPRFAVLLVGPAVVLFAGALGVALGRWAPWLGTAPLASIALIAISALVLSDSYAHPMRGWLAPFVLSDAWGSGISEFTLRPYALHLVYIAGLAAIAACAALARYRRTVFGALACVALVGTTAAGYAQVQEPSAAEVRALEKVLLHPDRMRTCEEIAAIRYCVFPGYEPWTEDWHGIVSAVLAAVPPEDRPRLTFAQLPAENEIYDAGWQWGSVRGYTKYRRNRPASEVNPTMHWARNSLLGQAELALGVRVAARAVGVEDGFVITDADVEDLRRPRRFGLRVGRTARTCMMLGQGRSIVALWLAASATPGARDAFGEAQALGPHTHFDPVHWGLDGHGWNYFGEQTVYWGSREALYAEELLTRDEGEVRSLIESHWDVLTDPDTSSDAAAALLGLPPLPSLGEMAARSEIRNLNAVRYTGSVACH